MFKSNKIQSKLQTQTILAYEHQGSYICRQMFWLPASSSVLNCFSILLLFTFIAQSFKIKAGIIVFFLLPWCLYLSFSGDFFLLFAHSEPSPGNQRDCISYGQMQTCWTLSMCAQALSWVAGNSLLCKLPCSLKWDGCRTALSAWHPARLNDVRDRASPDLPLMLQRAMVLSWSGGWAGNDLCLAQGTSVLQSSPQRRNTLASSQQTLFRTICLSMSSKQIHLPLLFLLFLFKG